MTIENQFKMLLAAAKETVEQNAHLADGDECTLKLLWDTIKQLDKEWGFWTYNK